MNELIFSIRKIIVLFFILFVGFIFIDDFTNINEVYGFIHQKEYLKAIVYFGNYILGVLAVMMLLLNKYTKFITLFLLLITITIEIGYRKLSDLGFGYGDALLILNEYSLANEALKSYGKQFLLPFFESFFFVTFLYFYTKKLYLKYSLFMGIIFSLITSFISYKIIKLSNGVRTAYVVMFKEPMILFYTSHNKLYIGKRKSVNILPNKPLFKHIIYIVDESVRGDKLGINGFDKNTTPFLNKKAKEKNFYNYGVASSGGVCSSYSNAVLLSGIQINQLKDTKELIRKNSIIFQYAKKSKFKTSFFDMQNSRNKLNNFFQPTDLQNYVDYSFFIGEDYNKSYKIYQKDLIGLKKLKEYINKNKNNYTFTYFVKEGSHFSYINKYPKNREIFKPVLSSDGWGEWNLKIKPKFLNTYYNSLNWGVDNFFKNIYKEFNNTDTLIIYTSDHGQNLMDDLSIKQTHCAKGPAPIVMAKVPLFIISMNNKPIPFKKENINHASHFNLFGTNLYFMAYDIKDINKLYGKILFNDLSNQKRYFTSGDIFGRSPMYKNKFEGNK